MAQVPFMESPRFPDDLSTGVAFGPEFLTVISRNQGGYEQANVVYERALCKGDCAHAVRMPDQLRTLLTFFRAVKGRAIRFRFKDWSDYRLAAADSLLVLVPGTLNQYQITKAYRAAVGFEEQRPLRKPVAGTVVLRDSGVVVVPGGSGGQYQVDLTTGIVTAAATQSRAISTHGVGVTHQVILASSLAPNLLPGDQVALSGVTGSAASALNGKLLAAVTVDGAVLTLNVDTTGLIAAGGSLTVYRQSYRLSAACEFDVPCRFDTDHMATGIQAYEVFSWGQIPIVEVRV